MNSNILSGVRVLDFTRVLAGPYATRILADFGAEVIKIQSKKTATGSDSNTSAYFNTWNRNKRSITLDMSYPEARKIVLNLTAISDVLIENFTPRVMPNWGLSYEKFKKVKPDLIMLSMSGMGQTGPWRDFVAFGPTIQALSGLTYLTSPTEHHPAGLGNAYIDTVAGLYAVFAILAALDYRDRRGEGQYIDLSQYEAACTLMGPAFLDMLVNHNEILPQVNELDYTPAAPYGCYRCLGTDRWCVIAVFNETEWQTLSKVMGYPEWTQEERFSTLSKRRQNSEALNELLEQFTVKQKAEELVPRLQGAGVPAGVVQNAEDLAGDPQVKAREYFVKSKHPVLGDTVSDASPIKLTDGTTPSRRAAPLLGEDNRYVYVDLLGMKESLLASYVETGIVG